MIATTGDRDDPIAMTQSRRPTTRSFVRDRLCLVKTLIVKTLIAFLVGLPLYRSVPCLRRNRAGSIEFRDLRDRVPCLRRDRSGSIKFLVSFKVLHQAVAMGCDQKLQQSTGGCSVVPAMAISEHDLNAGSNCLLIIISVLYRRPLRDGEDG